MLFLIQYIKITFLYLYLFKVILIVRGTAYELTSDDGRTMKKREIEELRTNQEESDTKMILYSIYGSQNG